MTILEEAFEKVHSGARFHIDFENRTMKVDGKKIIDNGEYDTTKALYNPTTDGDVLRVIELMYKDYKYSLPSERSDSKRRKYFKALPVEELSDKQMVIGTPREYAQFLLEGFMLCAIVNGDLKWTEDMGSWFWQSKSDADLIILRNWVENNLNKEEIELC